MTYVKCALVGLFTGLVAAVVWTAAALFLPFQLMALRGEGGLGSASVGFDTILPVALLGFLLGFHLKRRRQKRRSAAA
jgi:hypothetical protein